ncbi:MAG TPA: uroporphyrinogen decarboxylase family protein [Thermodesulfobacteriota bacterium]|nr:uroporphyrinogen decarboxylase family protein [Thermodesulfobacteriota bacterium]
MNKRELVLSVLDKGKKQERIPAAFFLHFDESHRRGRAAVDKHLEYFRHTGMDFVKIQYENNFPVVPEIRKPEDWGKLPLYQKDFYEDQLSIVDGLVKAAKKDAVVVMTLYSPFMCAGHASGGKITDHLKENPEKAAKGIEIAAESLMIFVKECVKLGIDGFYHSTQGAETFRFSDMNIFNKYIKPSDLALMKEINRTCVFNILHVCDYHGGYKDLTPFLEYPGHVVNSPMHFGSGNLSGKEISKLFGRPFMGGLERKGTILSGSEAQIRKEVKDILADAPEKFILGADCTIPSEVNWDNLKTAIAAAHEYKR